MHKGYNQAIMSCLLLLVFFFRNGMQYTLQLHAEVGSSIQLPCYANGTRPVFSVRLSKGSSSLLTAINGVVTSINSNLFSLNTTTYIITMSDVQINDEGEYLCSSDNHVDFNTETFRIIVHVYVLPTEVTLSAPLSRIPANDSQFVTCAVSRVYPADSLTFYILSTNNTITSLYHIDYGVNDDDTYSAEALREVTFVSEYNIHKLHCRVDYNGVRNNYSQLTSELEVIVESKPGKPHSLQIESRSYREIVFSFTPGHSNGYTQTLTILIKQLSEDMYTELSHDLYDPPPDARQEVTVRDVINKTTTYTIQVRADNEYLYGGPSVSEPLTVTTRGEVHLKAEMLRIRRKNDNVILSWPKPEGDYTSLAIERCTMGENCVTYDVTMATEIAFPMMAGANFTFIVYQDRDIVARGTFLLGSANNENQKSGGADNRSAASVIAGTVVAVVVICTVVGITSGIVYKKRKSRQLNQDNPYIVPEPQSDSAERKTTYIELTEGNKAQDPESPYEDVTDPGYASSSPHDNFNLNELAMKTKLCQGTYSVVYTGMLRNESCAVKTIIDTNCKVIDVKWLLSQIKTLRLTGYHKNLPHLLAFNTSMECVAIVMRFEKHRDLKTYLSNASMIDQYTNTSEQAKLITQQLAFGRDIVDGMLFLRRLTTVDLLCYQLSAKNILVGEDMVCKIVNFASAEDVKERQKICLNSEKNECIVPWLAPECILSVDEHITASDVWSFGVLLYEITVQGLDPYPDMDMSDIKTFVLNRKIMQAPPSSDHLYGIMVQCWRYEAINRPSWLTLQELFKALTKQYTDAATEYEIV